MVKKEIANLFAPGSIEEKKGKSYLISGLLRGMGVEYFEKIKIIEILEANSDPKIDKYLKESTLTLMETLFETLGKLCEPYVQKFVAFIMVYLSDNQEDIRNLSKNATKAMMQTLSGYGVKVVLPFFLKGKNLFSFFYRKRKSGKKINL